MTDLVVPAGGELLRSSPAAARARQNDAAHSDDPWVRGKAWADRWLDAHYVRLLDAERQRVGPGVEIDKEKLRRRTDSTYYQYGLVWRSLTTYGQKIDVPPLLLVRSDIDRWGAVLAEFGDPGALRPVPLSATTRAQRFAAASSFYVYCIEEACQARGCCDEGPGAPWVKRSPIPSGKYRPKASGDSPQQYLDVEQVAALQLAADERGTAAAALVSLLLTCLRVSAACNARIEQLGEIGGHKVLRVRDKGGKVRTIPLPPPIYRRIMNHVGDRTEGYILETRYGNPTHRSNAYALIVELAEAAGISGRVGPHTLRHAVVTRAFEKRKDLSLIQDMAGHTDPRTTQRYNRARARLDDSLVYDIATDYFQDFLDGHEELDGLDDVGQELLATH